MAENHIREIARPSGLVDVTVAARDTDCSALTLVWRLEHRYTRRCHALAYMNSKPAMIATPRVIESGAPNESMLMVV